MEDQKMSPNINSFDVEDVKSTHFSESLAIRQLLIARKQMVNSQNISIKIWWNPIWIKTWWNHISIKTNPMENLLTLNMLWLLDKVLWIYMIPMYLRPIQVPKGALIRTQRIIIIFFLKTGIGWRMIMSSLCLLLESHLRAFCWYSRAFLVSAEARVVYSTALSTWASILR